MSSTAKYRLTVRQIWQLTLSLVVIFYPIILYVNVPERSWDFLTHAYKFLLVEFGLIIFVYFVWISFTEWLLERLSERFGEEILVELGT